MKITRLSALGALALALCSVQALAQTGPNVTVGTAAGQVGSATPVVIPVDYDGDGTVVGFQFEITYDSATLTADISGCGGALGGQTTQCSESVAGTILVLAFDSTFTAIPSGSLGSLSFDISTAPIADYPLTVQNEAYGDAAEGDVPSTGTTNGLVQVTAGPQPEFTGTPAGLAMATEQGLADPTGSLTVTNTGQTDSLLTGTCTLLGGGSAEISMSNGGFTDIAIGAAGSVVGVACDATAAGSYAATLSCTHNGSNASPADFPVTCEIAPPGAASYVSTPAPGATIEMTPGGDVPVGATVPDQVLTISNGATDANDNDLVLMGCAWTGSGDITATAPTSPLAPMASTMVTFSCSAATVAANTGTYSCDYDTDADGSSDGTASYTVNCGVRAAASDIAESPASGAALRFVVPINGTGQTSVSFAEILDEGVDGTVDSCSMSDGSILSVVTTLPATVAAGTSVSVTVEGSDPFDGSTSVDDTLTCTYTDSDSDPGTASWPVTMTIQTAAIPTLSSWGLMLMILTMLGLGGIVIRRKTLS